MIKKAKNVVSLCLSAFIAITLFSGCSALPKGGISYSGEDRVFSKSFSFYKTEYRQAQGREPGWELGIAFQCHKAGRIKGLHIKNPTKGAVPVTIWDADTKQILFQLQANLDGSNAYNRIYFDRPVQVEAGRKYCVSINVAQYFYHVMPPGQLPMDANNITLLSSMYEDSHYTRYPQFEVRDVLHGLIDLDMQWVVN